MRGPRVVLSVVVLAVLLVGTQLAFTTVGQQTGSRWSDPAEVAEVASGPNTLVSDVAADGGSDGGAVAWVVSDGDRRTVRVAGFTARNGTVTVDDTRTVVALDGRLTGLDVAVDGGRLVVTWLRPVGSRIVVARVTDAGVDRRVVADPFRAGEPAVTLTSRGPVVAYTAADEPATPFVVRATHARNETVTHTLVGGPSHRAHVPAVDSAGDRLSVVWYQADKDIAAVTTARMRSSLTVDRSVAVGRARPTGSFAGDSRDAPFVASAHTGPTVRPVWTDVGDVTTTTVTDGTVGDRRTVGPGQQPGVAARGDRWLLAWVVPRQGTGDDVQFRDGEDTGGFVSLFPSNANWPRPAFAPDPAVAWVEWGGTDRVLVSAYREAASPDVLARLSNAPQRFAFLALAATIIGLVTVPIMPWSFLGLFGAFVLTTDLVRTRVFRAGAWLSTRLRREATAFDLRARLGDLPSVVWVVLFALAETPLVVWGVDAGLWRRGFAHPVGVSALALVAALALVVGARIASNWRAVITFVCLQNAAMWAVAVTEFL